MSRVRSWLVEDPLQDTGGDERTGERDPDPDLGAIDRRICRRRGLRRGRDRRRGLRAQALGLLGGAAGLLGLGASLLGLLAELALLARELLFGLLELVVRLGRLLLDAARRGLGDLRAQLSRACLFARALRLGARLGGRRDGFGLARGLSGGGLLGVRQGIHLLRALRVVLSHSGGSSPKMRRNTTAATRVVTIEASAPMPATRPDHARRLTRSLSDMAAESKWSRSKYGASPAKDGSGPAGMRGSSDGATMRRGRRRRSRPDAPWPARTLRRPDRACRRSSP